MNDKNSIESLRPVVKFALAWRIASELMRRHHAEHDLRISQYFPGLSPWGVLRLSIGKAFGNTRPDHGVELVVGGGGIGGTTASMHPAERYTRILEGEESVRIVNDIETRMGWVHRENGTTTAPILTARIIARFLERYMVAPTPYRLSPGGIDNAATGWDGSSTSWLTGLAAVQEASSLSGTALQNFQTRFWLLHRDDDNGPMVSWERDKGPAVVLDMATASCISLHAPKRVNLLNQYQKFGHRLRPLLHELETTLEAP